jgi:hypothetical protein
MGITQATFDTDNMSSLSDNPMRIEGLTPDQFKALQDKVGLDIKTYINDTLIPEIDDAVDRNNVLLWSGTLTEGQTATLSKSCLNYRFLLFRSSNLLTFMNAPVLQHVTAIRGTGTFVSSTTLEQYGVRTTRNADGTQITLNNLKALRTTFADMSLSLIDTTTNISEIWGVV